MIVKCNSNLGDSMERWVDHCIGEAGVMRGDDIRKIQLASIFHSFQSAPTKNRNDKAFVLTILMREGKKNKEGR